MQLKGGGVVGLRDANELCDPVHRRRSLTVWGWRRPESAALSPTADLKISRRSENTSFRPVHGELPFKRRLAVQTIRGNGFANGNSQGRLAVRISPRVQEL
jgi:hypothetical protein